MCGSRGGGVGENRGSSPPHPLENHKTTGITVRLGTVSVGAIGFMSIRNKYGRTLANPNFCSADTWSRFILHTRSSSLARQLL